MNRLSILAVGAAAALGMGPSAMAHHSFSMFDTQKTLSLSGVVAEFQYTNPHSWLQVSIVGADGKTTEWAFETVGPGSLLRNGIKVRTFVPGDKVTVVFHPMKDGRPAGSFVSATKADGSVFSTGHLGGAPAEEAAKPPGA